MTLIVPRQIAARWGGVGDVVASVAEPIKRSVISLAPINSRSYIARHCAGCDKRRLWLNKAIAFACK